jgi:gliding motility-associated-like protein
MRLKLLRLVAIIACVFFLSEDLFGQDCIPTNINGTTFNLSCSQTCTNLALQIPHIKGTSDYVLTSIPYNPYPYNTSTGIEDPILYIDDRYSGLINLPFTFCFYDSLFSSAVVGSNGLLTFEQAVAGCANSFVIDQPIPFAGSFNCSLISPAYYPRASIMPAFFDLDPGSFLGSSPPDRKIQWEVIGTAPCRKFVLSYYHIGVFGVSTADCASPLNTFQVVLHESTGIIDIFFLQKSCVSTTNLGNGIFGIQNWLRDKWISAPGKNNAFWTETNTGYRFTPSGNGSRYVSSQLFNLGGTLIASADTTTTVPGLLDVSFLNVCPPATNNTYVVRTIFSSCSDPSTTLISADTIYVNRTNNLNATATSSNITCGSPSGTIAVTIPAGSASPFSYVLDGSAPVIDPAFSHTFNNVSAGAHTVVVNDAGGCVSNTINVIVATGSGVNGTAIATATSCPTAVNGTVTANAIAGTAPFTYQLDAGVPQSGANPYTFTNVASGNHMIIITDNFGCNQAINISVPAGPALVANVTPSLPSCNGANNGTITVTPTNGNAPYTFSLDGGPQQVGAAPYTFANVAAGNHNIVVTDAAGCITNAIPVVVTAGPVFTTSASKTDVLCNGGANGTITVTQPTIGIAPYQYSLDGIVWQTSNIFNGLAANTYTIYYRESNGCQNSQPITVNEPAVLAATASATAVICNGENNGVITITPGGGIAPYQYSIDGGVTWQSSRTFNVTAGIYQITIKDANNCTTARSVTVTEPAVLTANSANSNAGCNGGNDGSITLIANGGNTPYQYSLDGITFQATNTFNVAPGNYTITIKDNLGCTTTSNTTVGFTNNLTLTPQTDSTICEGTSAQLKLNSNATQYAWTPVTGLSNPSIANPVANPSSNTQYIVTAILGPCSANDTVIVNVNTAPIPDAGPDGFICYGQTYQLQGLGSTQFSWTPSTYLSSASIYNPIVTPGKTTTYYLQVTDANGCNSIITDSVIVNVTPPIHVSTFPADTIGYPGDKFQLNAISLANIYTWSPATGLSNPNIPNPVLTVGAIGADLVYHVIASTDAGCKGEGYVRIKVYTGPDIYVPTGFTPNNDGKNDKFIPFPVGIKKVNYFKVFNRWGQMVYSTTTLNQGWDGKLGGHEQNSDVYVWMVQGITQDDKVITKQGTVMLIR